MTADCLPTTSRCWVLHFADLEPIELYCAPPATHGDIMAQYPDAVAAEPFEPTIQQPATELPKPDQFPDDRRTCGQCANLIGRQCQAAKRGEIAAGRNYEPIRDLPRRCEGYAPGPEDSDQRQGAERWPGLAEVSL